MDTEVQVSPGVPRAQSLANQTRLEYKGAEALGRTIAEQELGRKIGDPPTGLVCQQV